ncbi:MAG: hypothetical protein ACFFDF_24885 [Candidatus Odinarchaeota archaeon]
MSPDFSKFDEFKRSLGKRWSYISVFNTTEMFNLIIDSYRVFIYGLMNKGLDVDYHLDQAHKQIKNEWRCLKITKGDNPEELEEVYNGTLNKFLESD